MHRKKSFVILALVAIALLVYFFSRPSSKKKTGNIAPVYEDKIDKILIENQQGTITLIKKTALEVKKQAELSIDTNAQIYSNQQLNK